MALLAAVLADYAHIAHLFLLVLRAKQLALLLLLRRAGACRAAAHPQYICKPWRLNALGDVAVLKLLVIHHAVSLAARHRLLL